MTDILITPVFAFGFASPWLLAGLLTAGIPVLIHLLHKRKFIETEWAAMKFLLIATKKYSRRVRFEQLLVLLVRCLILLLLAIAFSRPYWSVQGAFVESAAPVHRIFVIDASFSMRWKGEVQSLFEEAKELATAQVSRSNPGDAFQLIQISNSSPQTLISRPSRQQTYVIDEIARMRPTEEFGNVEQSLQTALEFLGQAQELAQKEVIVISDFQSRSWSSRQTDQSSTRIRSLMEAISKKSTLILKDVGLTKEPNLAIIDFSSKSVFATLNQPVRLGITLHNFSELSQENVNVQLLVDGQLINQKLVNLPANADTQTEFTHQFTRIGDHRLEVRLAEDLLPLDNRRWKVMPVKKDIHVLLVNGRQSGDSMGKATDYLKLALSPSLKEQPWQGIIKPQVISEGELSNTELSLYDAVVICDVALFTENERDLLKSYVKSGGGLILSLGAQVNVDNYNQTLFQPKSGLIPLKLLNRQGDAQKHTTLFEFDPLKYQHPVIEIFKGNPDAGLETTHLYEYFQAEVLPDPHTRLILNYDTNDPAIVERTLGRGKVVLITTSLDRQWGTWAIWPSFPPLMNELVLYVSTGKWGRRDAQIGQPLEIMTLENQIAFSPKMIAPDQKEFPLQSALDRNTDSRTITFNQTFQSGIYELDWEKSALEKTLYAVNVSPRESDLKHIGPQLIPPEYFRRQSGTASVSNELSADRTSHAGFSEILLFTVLALIVVEQLLLWRFSIGALSFLAVMFLSCLSFFFQ
ncbi:BatA domain-containing protein [uncultured Gimesia sp.]|uniref:BatA domain-containing protein n=1 Tax=uncultured Gimesia sp. TaxID=1678688 RepID=UPI0026182228|nr:BatA domain-containing protein [uncultured Gimesia sp.]